MIILTEKYDNDFQKKIHLLILNDRMNPEFCMTGMIAFFGALVLLLVVAVIVWRPRDAGIYPMKHWKPQYRSLGAPPPVPSYMRYDVGHWPDKAM